MAEYSQKIIEHFTSPKNVGELEPHDVEGYVGNPVCGDQLHLFARIEEDRIVECSFQAYGCAASLATASILCEHIQGMHLDDLLAIEEESVTSLVGGLTPTQKHCATIGRDVLRNLVHTYRGEKIADEKVACR